MDSYIDRKFKPGSTRSNVYFDTDGRLRIEIACINLNFGAFWGGEWQSYYLIDTQGCNLEGHVDINNHYFEAGNVQVNLKKDFAKQNLEAATGEAIVKAIEKLETNYQQVTDDMHESFKESLFKRIRRVKPVYGHDFDWGGKKLMA